MPICAIYARVSTDMQGESIQNQIEYLRDYAKHRGNDWTTPDEYIYVDDGISGTTAINRPSVMMMLDNAKLGKFDTVLFKGISRFSRDIMDSQHMMRFLKAINVRMISIEENYDSANAQSEFLFNFHSLIAQSESEKTSIRTKLSCISLAKQGKWPNGSTPLGYNRDGVTKHLIIDKDESQTVSLIYRMYVERGVGMHTIATYLNEHNIRTRRGNKWTQVRISEILTNSVYIGNIVYGLTKAEMSVSESNPLDRHKRYVNVDTPPIVITHAHPPIITDQAFYEAQNIIRSRQPGERRPERHLLSGILYCGKCSHRMNGRRQTWNGHVYKYYYCSSVHYDGACGQPTLNGYEFDNLIVEYLRRRLDKYSYESLRESVENASEKMPVPDLIGSAKKRLAQIDDEILNANVKSMKHIIDDDILRVIMQNLNNEKQQLNRELTRMQHQLVVDEHNSHEVDQFMNNVNRFRDLADISDDNVNETRLILHSLIKRIIVDGQDYEIHLQFDI